MADKGMRKGSFDNDQKREVKNNRKTLMRIPIIKSYHAVPFTNVNEIPLEFASLGNDLASENLASDLDMTAADLQDFGKNRK